MMTTEAVSLISLGDSCDLIEESKLLRQQTALGVTRVDIQHPDLGPISLFEIGTTVLRVQHNLTDSYIKAEQARQQEARRVQEQREELRRREASLHGH